MCVCGGGGEGGVYATPPPPNTPVLMPWFLIVTMVTDIRPCTRPGTLVGMASSLCPVGL